MLCKLFAVSGWPVMFVDCTVAASDRRMFAYTDHLELHSDPVAAHKCCAIVILRGVGSLDQQGCQSTGLNGREQTLLSRTQIAAGTSERPRL